VVFDWGEKALNLHDKNNFKLIKILFKTVNAINKS
jgi:hypothetical protein